MTRNRWLVLLSVALAGGFGCDNNASSPSRTKVTVTSSKTNVVWLPNTNMSIVAKTNFLLPSATNPPAPIDATPK